MDNKQKVLIIEDNADMVHLMTQKFTEEKFDVLSSNDGKRGLELALDEHPDVIILDIMLPHIDGISILNQLRKDQWGEHVPVILFTNLDPNDKLVQAVIEHKPSYYLIKANTSLAELVQKVQDILSTA